MEYYFIGIKGTGMASLACILHDLGHKVSGSDLSKHFFPEDELRKRNIEIKDFSEDNIHSNMNIIVGNAFLDDFLEVKKAKADPTNNVKRYHEFLGELIKNYESVAVAGSHGKTTTTSILSAMMNHIEPTGYLIGDGTGHVDENCQNIVVEADEFRRHFIAYYPDYAIITNADVDHVDYFKTDEAYYKAFEDFIGQVKKAVVMFGDDPTVRGLKVETKADCYYYGLNDDNDFVAKDVVETTKNMKFSVYYHGEKYGDFDLPLVGHHLLWNALGVIAIGYLKGYKANDVNEGICTFRGAKRRFVVEEMSDGNIFIDDYAHHPTEVKVTIQAAKLRYPNKKIVAIFKPHRVSRLYRFGDDFAKALKQADKVYLCPFSSIDDKEEGIDIDITFLQNKIEGSQIVDETEESAKLLASESPAVYLFMSSKDIYNLANLVKRYHNS